MKRLNDLNPGDQCHWVVQGPAGALEILVNAPTSAPRGVALLGHPQPLLGGSAMHKIPQLLARELQSKGWLAVRPNFRGVGASEGVHDEGRGETADMVWLCQELTDQFSTLPLALVGFSFGGYVMGHVAQTLDRLGRPAARVAVLAAPVGPMPAGRSYEPALPVPGVLYVHGERDERVPLQSVLDWCGLHQQTVLVVPGGDHFFTGKLPLLRDVVAKHLEQALG